MPTRVAVLGGRGWLGGAIAHAAQQRGLATVVLTRTATPGALAVDLTDAEALARALAGYDVVVNATGRTAGPKEAFTDANVALPERLGRLAADHGWRLVHLGSAAEYGAGAAGPFPVSEGYPAGPTSAYGRSKLAGTEALLRWQERGADVLVARVFNVVGSDMPPVNPVHGFVTQVVSLAGAERQAADRPVLVPAGTGVPLGSGALATRPVVDVGDPTTIRDVSVRPWVADALVGLALAGPWPSHPIVNVCSGVPTSFGRLAAALGRQVGLDVDVRDMGWARGGRIVGDPRRLRSLVQLPPAPSIDDVARAALGPAAMPSRRDPAGETR